MRKSYFDKDNGFSLIELIVVLAGLGILSSLAIPKVINYLNYARVDEAKALLNSAAADCLQDFRRKGRESLEDSVDENILSKDRLESTGYKFLDIESTSNCGNTLIRAISPKDQEHMPDLGFTISSEGRLTKVASTEYVDTSHAAITAKGWAGINVTKSEDLKDLMDYNLEIQDAKASCLNTFDTWLKNTGDGSFNTWNDAANSGCPTKPPKVVNNNCTTNGCNKKMFYLDGEFCGTEPEDHEKCIKDKLGAICAEKLQQHKIDQTTSSSSRPTTITECGNKEYWFCKGVNKGSKAGLETCLREDEEALCVSKQEEARETGHTGKFGPLPGPGKCSEIKWVCENTFVSEQDYYINCDTPAKEPPAKCSDVLKTVDLDCLEYELTETLIQKCQQRPMLGGSKNCGEVGKGRPSNRKGWDKFPACAQWAKCMGLQ
uniref:type IV pilin protein n=1 Tax=Synechococcus sp. UW106 TaxID=368495 RepID=UPI000E0EF213|nr:type II secretion system protein [Synechococcus sp. UW106]